MSKGPPIGSRIGISIRGAACDLPAVCFQALLPCFPRLVGFGPPAPPCRTGESKPPQGHVTRSSDFPIAAAPPCRTCRSRNSRASRGVRARSEGQGAGAGVEGDEGERPCAGKYVPANSARAHVPASSARAHCKVSGRTGPSGTNNARALAETAPALRVSWHIS